MSGHHHHHDHSGPIAIGATAARVVVWLLIAVGALTLAGVWLLWPEDRETAVPLPLQSATGGAVQTEAATVIRQEVGTCGSPSQGKVFLGQPEAPQLATYTCQRNIIEIESGPDEGAYTLFEFMDGPGQPDLQAGDEIRVGRQGDPTAPGTTLYSFEDYSRGMSLTWLVAAFGVAIVVVARWRGLRALIGLGFAFAVLVGFLLPALLAGEPAIPVAMVAGSLILYAVLYLAHGVNLRTSSALLGTLTSMLVAAVLSWIALGSTHITGLSEDQTNNVAVYLDHVSITGLLLAGFIIGSLGVLNDVTITQASTAFELAALDEQASRREIFTASMRVGRDHIASTVYTLVLAYAGGALPLLLLFSVSGRSITDVLVGDAVAVEIARSAVGGIALTLSVPLTTGIAVLLARPFGGRSRVPAQRKSAPDKPRTAGQDGRNSTVRDGRRAAAQDGRTAATPDGRSVAVQGGPGPGAQGGRSAAVRDGRGAAAQDGRGTAVPNARYGDAPGTDLSKQADPRQPLRQRPDGSVERQRARRPEAPHAGGPGDASQADSPGWRMAGDQGIGRTEYPNYPESLGERPFSGPVPVQEANNSEAWRVNQPPPASRSPHSEPQAPPRGSGGRHSRPD